MRSLRTIPFKTPEIELRGRAEIAPIRAFAILNMSRLMVHRPHAGRAEGLAGARICYWARPVLPERPRPLVRFLQLAGA